MFGLQGKTKGSQPGAAPVGVRWMIRQDMPNVLAIEGSSELFPWDEEQFLAHLRNRNTIGTVAEADGHVVAYLIYELAKDFIVVNKLCVESGWRNHGIGSEMIRRLLEKLNHTKRTGVCFEVPESNLDALFFLKRNGFRAENILRGGFPPTGEDLFTMVYRKDSHGRGNDECRGR